MAKSKIPKVPEYVASLNHPYRDDILHWMHFEIVKSNHDDRLLVLTANAGFEVIINAIVNTRLKRPGELGDKAYHIKLLVLFESGLLSETLFDTLNWLRQIRNDAAHLPFFRLTEDWLQKCPFHPTARNDLAGLLIDISAYVANPHWWYVSPVLLPNMVRSPINPEPAIREKNETVSNFVRFHWWPEYHQRDQTCDHCGRKGRAPGSFRLSIANDLLRSHSMIICRECGWPQEVKIWTESLSWVVADTARPPLK
jgi:hypothetical protein